MDPDLNRYDSEHAVTGHPLMSREAWEKVYADAWKRYYTPEHMETILRRAGATGIHFGRLTSLLLLCSQCNDLERVHPMQGGVLRRKVRVDRRPGLRVEPAWSFYPKFLVESVWKLLAIGRQAYILARLRRRIERDPLTSAYTDVALHPVDDQEVGALELFARTRETAAGRSHEAIGTLRTSARGWRHSVGG
jgi:hypothetical protein